MTNETMKRYGKILSILGISITLGNLAMMILKDVGYDNFGTRVFSSFVYSICGMVITLCGAFLWQQSKDAKR